MRKILCFFGLHYWEYPGGHCMDCHACDEFFGRHRDKFVRVTPNGPERWCNGDHWELKCAATRLAASGSLSGKQR